MLNYAIIGRKGSGKSTVCKYINDLQDGVTIKFADTLKDMCRLFLNQAGFSDARVERMIEGDEKESRIPYLDFTPRHMMQTIGTEWGRNCLREDIWGLLWEQQVEREKSCNIPVTCDDVRFDNEVQRAENLGFTLVRIVSPNESEDDEHASEQLPLGANLDVFILNDKETAFNFDLMEVEEEIYSMGSDDIVVVYGTKVMTLDNGKLSLGVDATYDEISELCAWQEFEEECRNVYSAQDEANRHADDLYMRAREERYER